MMTKHQIQNCLTFLGRADIKGAEAPAMMEVVNALHSMVLAHEAAPSDSGAPEAATYEKPDA